MQISFAHHCASLATKFRRWLACLGIWTCLEFLLKQKSVAWPLINCWQFLNMMIGLTPMESQPFCVAFILEMYKEKGLFDPIIQISWRPTWTETMQKILSWLGNTWHLLWVSGMDPEPGIVAKQNALSNDSAAGALPGEAFKGHEGWSRSLWLDSDTWHRPIYWGWEVGREWILQKLQETALFAWPPRTCSLWPCATTFYFLILCFNNCS